MSSKDATETISPSRLQRDFETIVRQAGAGKRFVVRSRGRTASLALVPTKLLERLLEDEDDRRVLAERKNERLIPWSKVRNRLGR
jgi:hypothetical protein